MLITRLKILLVAAMTITTPFALTSCSNTSMIEKVEASNQKRIVLFTLNAGELKIIKIGDDVDVEYLIQLNEQTLITIKERYVDLHAYFNSSNLGEIVILSKANGGNACPAKFYLMEFPINGKPHVTDEFGTCDESPVIIQDDKQVTMKFHPNLPISKNRTRYNTPPSIVWNYSALGLKRVR